MSGDMIAHTHLPADADIRPALRRRVQSAQGGDTDTAVIEELGICRGRVRVDLAVVNGTIHGYEIKSDRDSLCRLAAQAEVYSRVLDRATLVVGARHLAEATDMLPPWWGILHFEVAAGGLRLKTLRRAKRNCERDPRSLVELLWMEDALALLDKHSASRGVRGKPRRIVWDRVCDAVPVDDIAAAVRASLKARAMRPAPSPQS